MYDIKWCDEMKKYEQNQRDLHHALGDTWVVDMFRQELVQHIIGKKAFPGAEIVNFKEKAMINRLTFENVSKPLARKKGFLAGLILHFFDHNIRCKTHVMVQYPDPVNF